MVWSDDWEQYTKVSLQECRAYIRTISGRRCNVYKNEMGIWCGSIDGITVTHDVSPKICADKILKVVGK